MSFSTNRFSRKALLLVTAVFSASLLWAQATGISGRVLDETGAPVIGATVMVKGTTIATATNVDGTFNLKNTGRNVTLVVSYVGYEAQQVASKSSPWATVPRNANRSWGPSPRSGPRSCASPCGR